MKLKRSRFFGRRSRRGLTLIEVMIASVISLMITGTAVGIMWSSGVGIKEMYGQTRTRSSRMIALDAVRYRLAEAQIGSVSITDSNHRIEFEDPNLGGATSAFFFNPESRTLWYDDDIDDATAEIEAVQGPIDFTFESQNAGAVILLRVESAEDMAHGDVDTQDGETAVYLRNI